MILLPHHSHRTAITHMHTRSISLHKEPHFESIYYEE